MDMETPADRLLNAVMQEVKELYPPGHSDDSDEQPTTADPSASMSPAAFLNDVRSSQTYAAIDRVYAPPPFPCPASTIQPPKGDMQWMMLKAFAYLKAKTLPPDSSLDAKANYLRTIISYVRDCALLPPEYTGELAVSRILAGLAYRSAFRDRLHKMLNRDKLAFSDSFYEVLTYICCNHADPLSYRRSKTVPRRRIAVPEDVPLPPRRPSPPADETPDPPPYRARLYRTSIEELGSRTALRIVAFAALRESRRLVDALDALDHHLPVLQALLAAIRESEHPVATPYFDDMSDADLRAVFEGDAALAGVLNELKRTAANIQHDKTDHKFLDVVGRVVNHLCQPRKRTRATTRSVRFAPF